MRMMQKRLFLVALLGFGCASPPKRDAASLVQLEGDSIMVRENIGFQRGKAELEEGSTDLLDAVAQILLNTSTITRLSIEGHTDATGDAEGNLVLSSARALAVKKYLESKGVDPERLSSKGFGASRPVDTNDTEAGRGKNRRVEFKVVR